MNILEVLQKEKNKPIGALYYYIQTEFAYNSNKIEGSKLTQSQTRQIFENKSVYQNNNEPIRVTDIIETNNHFRCVDKIIDTANERLSEEYIKEIHKILKTGTHGFDGNWAEAGEYKRVEKHSRNCGNCKTRRSYR